MICPNCGKTVRSKHQCAHCGHVFSSDEIKAMKKGTVVPKNPVSKESYDYDENTGYDEYAKDTVNNQEYEREPVIDSKKENRTVARDEELQTQREPVPTPVVPDAPESNQVDADDPFQIDEEEMRRIQAENDLDEASNYDDQDFEEDYYEDDDEKEPGGIRNNRSICEVNIAKHRNGPTGTVELAWIARHTKFGNLERTMGDY